MATAENARRTIAKRTYVPLEVPDLTQDRIGGAVSKLGFVRNLSLQAGEVEAVERAASDGGPAAVNLDLVALATLRQFEGTPLSVQVPGPAAFVGIPASGLLAFGRAVVQLRQAAATGPDGHGPVQPSGAAGAATGTTTGPGAAVAMGASIAMVAPPMAAVQAVNAGLVAVKSFENQVTATPVGMLNLERVEMTPAGIQRGELVATIPLAPKEQTAVVQKEWSVTTKEFTSIVTDSLENFSETGVTENNELSQSTTSQVQHANQFNINSTVSGGCSFVTATVSTSFATQDATSKSATESQKHAKQTTALASSRVKREHKTTISTTTVTGTSETTTRTLENPSDTNPIRIDYFSLMRKWRVRLYRYGLRMTYDLAIPEPGATLRETHAQIDELTAKINQTFEFGLKPGEISRDNYVQLASDYQAAVPEPPRVPSPMRIGGAVPGLGKLGDDESWHFFEVAFNVPDGCVVVGAELDAMIGNVDNKPVARNFVVFGYGQPQGLGTNGKASFVEDMLATNGFLSNAAGAQKIIYFLQNVDAAAVTFVISFAVTADAMAVWQMTAWHAMHDAARDSFYAQQSLWAQERSELQARLNADTLTLRREENDEIMKGVLRWLLGTGFEFMPPDVLKVFKAAGGDLQHGVSFTGNDLGIKPYMWTTMYQYEEMVKFINEAIEWENVLYFLYSYFWDVPLSWDFIRQIEHPDATRQAFLRAGSARVVLPVRKGYEQAWLAFVELGDFGHRLPDNHPYMTIAQQIQAYDETNYPGIPPANPGAVPVEPVDMAAAVSTDKVAASASPVTIKVDSTTNFLVGARLTVDRFASGVQEVQSITAIPDSTHLTLAQLANAHDGSNAAFPLVQAGESGVVIAEWNEYTPTSGVDIAVTSNLATIA